MIPFRRCTAFVAGAVSVVSIAGSIPTAGALAPLPSVADAVSVTVAPAVRDFDPHTVLVAFRPDVAPDVRAALHAANAGTVASTLDFQNLDVVCCIGHFSRAFW